MQNTQQFLNEAKERFLSELFDLLRIPSISADSLHAGDVRKTAEFVCESLNKVGLKAQVFETAGHPVVYAEKIVDQNKPTVLVYGHYDVQPVDPIELWETAPFEPQVRDGKIYARGSADDKGQMFMHVKALEALIATGELPCNVKCIIEGEEEIGSVHLESFVEANRELLSADVVFISDTSMITNDTPSITVGLRGLSYLEVTVTGPNRDLHSGVYGGAVANPCNVLCDMIANLKDSEGRITIPGFYDDVAEVSEFERTAASVSHPVIEEYSADLGVQELVCESGYTSFESATIRPTLDVNGIWGGYTGEGAKTVLPSIARAKISMRLVPNQTSKNITEIVKAHLVAMAPKTVSVEVMEHHGGEPSVTPIDSLEYKAASLAMEKTFGKLPVPTRCGGSIPIVAMFKHQLGIQSVLMGFGLDSDNIHSPNEKYGVWNFYKGIETIPWFYHFYTEQKTQEK